MNFGTGQEHNCRRIRLSEFVNLHAFAASFPGQHTEPVSFMLVDLHVAEARLFQRGFQLRILINAHTADALRPLFIAGDVAAAFVADEKRAVRL